ncbi:tRNA-specific adenosine deaminase 1 [Ochlerotatus camptorhynchus]|uniref:tRNA-specific adenosine deaminase 1 n=1 Tax=Ochlerotatus camptorhynchus TaxID=644619 RepID=UPI0031DD203F
MDLANRISEICLAKFDALPKTGKPNEGFEWTILSAIVKVELNSSEPKIEVVALGTGTKCLGSNQLSVKGDVLNDSHAEIMARRGFLRYLMSEMKNASVKRSRVFEYSDESKKLRMHKEVAFHFFTTHSPCGDASIFELADRPGQDGPPAKKMKSTCDGSKAGSAFAVAEGMTGGKLLQCPGPDMMAQDMGMIRTKPGKGVRTLSVSCSDKMARWNMLGVQGSLLTTLLEEPIYLESIVICGGTEFSKEAIERALWIRWDGELMESVLKQPFRLNKPNVVLATNGKLFRFRKNRDSNDGSKFQPAPGGIVWCGGVDDRPLEVEIGGRRQGITKKKLGTPAARLKISKIELFSTFVSLRNALRIGVDGDGVAAESSNADVQKNLSPPTGGHCQDTAGGEEGEIDASTSGAREDLSSLRYADAKELCRSYREQWNTLRTRVFRVWSEKPSCLLDFTLNSQGSV